MRRRLLQRHLGLDAGGARWASEPPPASRGPWRRASSAQPSLPPPSSTGAFFAGAFLAAVFFGAAFFAAAFLTGAFLAVVFFDGCLLRCCLLRRWPSSLAPWLCSSRPASSPRSSSSQGSSSPRASLLQPSWSPASSPRPALLGSSSSRSSSRVPSWSTSAIRARGSAPRPGRSAARRALRHADLLETDCARSPRENRRSAGVGAKPPRRQEPRGRISGGLPSATRMASRPPTAASGGQPAADPGPLSRGHAQTAFVAPWPRATARPGVGTPPAPGPLPQEPRRWPLRRPPWPSPTASAPACSPPPWSVTRRVAPRSGGSTRPRPRLATTSVSRIGRLAGTARRRRDEYPR